MEMNEERFLFAPNQEVLLQAAAKEISAVVGLKLSDGIDVALYFGGLDL